MKIGIVQNVIVAILLSLVSNYIVYYGFTTNYTKNAFSEESFNRQYDHGIYKYRIISKQFLIGINDFLEKRRDDKPEERILLMDKDASGQFYLAYFILNTFFLVLTSVALVFLLELKNFSSTSRQEKQYILFFTPLLIAITQFVITPYDNSAYFIHLLILLVFLKLFETRYIICLLSVCILLFLSALNRETAAITLAFLVLIAFLKYGFSRRSITFIAAVIASFLAAYISVRYFLDGSARMFEDIRFLNNFLDYTNIIGIAFWGLFFYLSVTTSISKENAYIILVFHLFCLPYILLCLLTGILFEVRLYLPIFFSSMFLSKMDTSGFRYRLSNFSIRDILSPKR